MKRIFLNIGLLFAAALLCVACENDIDNYDAPNGGLFGRIYDLDTGEDIPLPVQGAGGVMLTLTEINTDATAPTTFYALQDGTYRNTKVFDGYYRLTVGTCPLVGISEGYVTVKGQTRFDIGGIPFSRVTITAEVSPDNKVTVSYQIDRADSSFPIEGVAVLWNYVSGVDVNAGNYAGIEWKRTDRTGSHTFELANDREFVENHYKILSNKNRIYVRVAAQVSANTNYSKTLELTIN